MAISNVCTLDNRRQYENQQTVHPTTYVWEGSLNSVGGPHPANPPEANNRNRKKPGVRRTQILSALAELLEQPDVHRITTATLAARVDVSEAALYRHFESKAQMLDGLIEFIERSIFTLVDQIGECCEAGHAKASLLVGVLLQFAEKNPGMTRVMVGDALLFENERLQRRMNLFFDKFEAALLTALGRTAETAADAAVRASVLRAFSVGRLQRFARSGFRQQPSEDLVASLTTMFVGFHQADRKDILALDSGLLPEANLCGESTIQITAELIEQLVRYSALPK